MALPEILLMSDVLYQKCMKQLTLSSANTQILYIKYQGSFQQQYLWLCHWYESAPIAHKGKMKYAHAVLKTKINKTHYDHYGMFQLGQIKKYLCLE